MRFGPSGRTLVSAGSDAALLSIDVEDGSLVAAIAGKSATSSTEPGPARFLKMSQWMEVVPAADGKLAAVASEGVVRLVDSEEGTTLRYLVGNHWGEMSIEDVDLEWSATPYEWLRVASPFALVGRTSEAFYPTAAAERTDLGAAMAAGKIDPPAIALPWWQVAPIYLGLVAGAYALVLRRLRSFERRQG